MERNDLNIVRERLNIKDVFLRYFVVLFVLLTNGATELVQAQAPNVGVTTCPHFSIPASALNGGFDLGGEKVPISRSDVKERIEFQINFLLLDARSVLAEWLNERRKYSWIFEEIFSKEGVPKDFAWLSPILVGMSRSNSRLAPVGVWSLDKPCGSSEAVEMTADSWRDDRLDIHLATRCFAGRIKSVNTEVGAGWLMASVAYVQSPKTVKDLIEKWNSSNVWDIPLPDNAEDMLSRWAAFKIIGTNRSFYGLKSGDPAPLTYDNLTSIELTKDLSIGDIAKFVKASPRLILELNPKIKPNSGVFPARDNGRQLSHSIAVPSGSGHVLLKKLQEAGFLASGNRK